MDIKDQLIQKEWNRFNEKKQERYISNISKSKQLNRLSVPRLIQNPTLYRQQKCSSLIKIDKVKIPCIYKFQTLQNQQNILNPICYELDKYNQQQKKNKKLIDKLLKIQKGNDYNLTNLHQIELNKVNKLNQKQQLIKKQQLKKNFQLTFFPKQKKKRRHHYKTIRNPQITFFPEQIKPKSYRIKPNYHQNHFIYSNPYTHRIVNINIDKIPIFNNY